MDLVLWFDELGDEQLTDQIWTKCPNQRKHASVTITLLSTDPNEFLRREFRLTGRRKSKFVYFLFGILELLPGDGFLEFVKLLKLLDNRDVSSAA